MLQADAAKSATAATGSFPWRPVPRSHPRSRGARGGRGVRGRGAMPSRGGRGRSVVAGAGDRRPLGGAPGDALAVHRVVQRLAVIEIGPARLAPVAEVDPAVADVGGIALSLHLR